MISSLLEVAKRAKSYDRSDHADDKTDSLSPLFSQIEPLTPLHEEIRRCIIGEDEIADDASPALSKIRKSIRGMNDRIHAQLTSLMNNTTTRSFLQDAVITMRDGRYCLPVKAEAKTSVPGMVHDQSSSGSTLFIEPMAVVNLNNELRELFLKEQEEINAILADLSNRVAENAYLQNSISSSPKRSSPNPTMVLPQSSMKRDASTSGKEDIRCLIRRRLFRLMSVSATSSVS